MSPVTTRRRSAGASSIGSSKETILSGDRLLAEHLGSCVTCFRALTELRDTPRLAKALLSEAPVRPPPNDRFWDDLAARTTAAAQS